MSFIPVHLDGRLTLDSGCYALFFLKRTSQGQLTPDHVGIVTIDEPTIADTSTVVQWQEWPLDCSRGSCVDPIVQGVGMARLSLALAVEKADLVLLGWKVPSEAGATPDSKQVASAAWRILVAADWSVLGRPLSWRLWPSWAENHRIRRRMARHTGSCGGFVQVCFAAGGLMIVDVEVRFTDEGWGIVDDPARLPGMTVPEFRELDTVLQLTDTSETGGVAPDEEILRYGEKNLGGPPPWHFLLPGYLLKAFVEGQYPLKVQQVSDCFHPV